MLKINYFHTKNAVEKSAKTQIVKIMDTESVNGKVVSANLDNVAFMKLISQV